MLKQKASWWIIHAFAIDFVAQKIYKCVTTDSETVSFVYVTL